MRKTFKAIIVLLFVAVLTACSQEQKKEDAFSTSYSELNGSTTGSGKVYRDVNLPEDHVFTVDSESDILDLLDSENKATGVIYFGFPACPWCRSSIELMDEAAKAVSLNRIHTVDVYDMRDVKEKDAEGKIVTTKEGSDFYYEVLKRLGDWAPEYSGLDDPTERRIHTPLVVVIVEGEIVASHLGTIESQEDPFVEMTQAQHDEMVQTYKDMFSLIPGCGEVEGKNVC